MDPMKLMTGVDIPIPELGTSLHQPSILEISYVGETEYFLVMQLFSFDKNILLAQAKQGASNLADFNNFQVFMTMINMPEYASRKNDVLAVLTLLFPGYQPQFVLKDIYLNNATTQHNFTLNENNFDAFREVAIAVSALNNSAGGQNGGFNPRGKKAAEIAAKLMRGRQRASKDKNAAGGSVLSRYVSILTVGIPSMSYKDCLNLTVYQLYDLIERFTLHMSWDIDIRSRLAGGKPEKEPDDWMKNLH